jgi:hypothetical protein
MPELFKIDQCGSCHQPIIWAKTTAGKAMPVDAEPPLQGGTIVLDKRPDGTLLARVLTKTQLAGTSFGRKDLRTSHFARCPQADRWRARARARTAP